MFIAPPAAKAKPTLFSKIGALRRVSSFSSLSSQSPSPPATPTAASSPRVRQEDDAADTLPRDIPRSNSVMSWFSSDDEAADSRKPWRMPKLRRKTRTSPKTSTFTFTTSASDLSSEDTTLRSSLGPPLSLCSEPDLLPAVHPIELDLALDFDCAFPRPYDSYDDESEPPSPPFTPSLHPYDTPARDHSESPWYVRHPRESACWYDDDESGRRARRGNGQALYAPSSSGDSSAGPSSPRSSLRRTSRRSPEMTEADAGLVERDDGDCVEDEPEFFGDANDHADLDPDVCRHLAAFRILPSSRSPDAAAGRANSSVESLLDPHFASPSTPSPTMVSTVAFPSPPSPSLADPVLPRSPLRTKTSFSFPLPPTTTTTTVAPPPPTSRSRGGTRSTIAFLGIEIEEDDDSPWYDCNP
ncbi:hypothetical protein JCM11491_006016 [Sporobolomyces phaffii]